MVPQRVVAIGTSAFFGVGDPLYGGFIGRFKSWHQGKNIHNEVYNLGISREKAGETTTELLHRIVAEAKERGPQLILLTSGINDVRRIGGKENPPTTPKEQFEKNIKEMIAKAQPLADVIFISPIPIKEKRNSNNDYWLSEDLQEYTKIVEKVCNEEHIPYLNIHDEWLQEDWQSLLTPDGVHPNEQGHEKIFQRLKGFLEEIYR
jgi:lysophospholipase L1-like esterase